MSDYSIIDDSMFDCWYLSDFSIVKACFLFLINKSSVG